MATYLPGVTDYIPQIQPFSPDYNFYAGALQLRQSKQDAAEEQLSTLYGSLFHAPLTRDDNTASRDRFFKTIDQDIKKMAGMDLSKQQNVTAAAGIFNQLLDNKAIQKDMVWTKNFQSELQRAEGFKNCTDPEKCGGEWWEGGERLLYYQQQEFKNASAQDAMSFGQAEYVPYQNINKQAIELAEKANLNIEYDTVGSQWVTTTKNGVALVKPLTDLFMGTLAQDPKVAQYYDAKARLQRKDFIHENKDKYGGLEQAEQAYLQEMTPFLTQLEESLYGKEQELVEQEENLKQKIDKVTTAANNATPENKSKLDLIKEELENAVFGYQSTKDHVTQLNNQIKVAKNHKQFRAGEADALISAYFMSNDIGSIAETLSYKDAKQTHKVNQYGLESVKFKNRMMLEEVKLHNDLYKMKQKHAQDLQMEEYKARLKAAAKKLKEEGAAEENVPISVDVKGLAVEGESKMEGKEWSYDNIERGFTAYEKDREGKRLDVSRNERSLIQQAYTRSKNQAVQNDAQAKEDLVSIVQNYLEAGANIENARIGAPSGYDTDPETGQPIQKPVSYTGEFRNNLRRMQNARTTEQKYQIAKSIDLDLDKVAGTQVDYMYDNIVEDMFNTTEANKALRSYLQPITTGNPQIFRNIAAKRAGLEQLDKLGAEFKKDIIGGMSVTGSAYDKKWIHAVDAYLDKDGHINNEETFVKNMVAKGYDATAARDLYRADREGDEWFDVEDAPGRVDLPWYDWTEWETSGRTDYGIHSVYKRAFSEFAKPKGTQWMGATGAGDIAAPKAKRYEYVDSAKRKSTAVMGTVSIMRDIAANPNAVIEIDDFDNNLPKPDKDEAKEAAVIWNTILNDISIANGKKDNRPIFTVTYSDIAASDAGKVGANIKINNQEYLNRYKGSDENQGIMRPYMEELMTKGITGYIDRSATNNMFTELASKTPNEVLMDWTGSVPFSGEYLKDVTVKRLDDGQLYTSGYYKAGINEQTGKPDWQFMEWYDSPLARVDKVIREKDTWFREHAKMAKVQENTYLNSR